MQARGICRLRWRSPESGRGRKKGFFETLASRIPHQFRFAYCPSSWDSRNAPAIPATSRDVEIPADAERRQLTVTICDLVGSPALSVTGYDGFVAKYMGDGVRAYFGDREPMKSAHAAPLLRL